jgi:glycyl-tRNA synthetase beta chain
MAEFLLELLSEDIPARMQVQAAEDLKRLVTEKLAEAGLSWDKAVAHSTPRRLTLLIKGLPLRAPDRTDERKGPKVGSPDGAIQGFLKSSGLGSIADAEIRETDKGPVYFAVREVPGENTADLLAKAILSAIEQFPWPKSMRWGDGTARWARPLHSVLALFEGDVLRHPDGTPFAFALPGLEPLPATETTIGHRFLAPDPFAVKSIAEYEQKLLDHYVVADREKRKWRILGDAKRRAEEHGLVLVPDEPLLEEVAGLVEWPVVLVGSIDNAFMALPSEVRRTTMRANQKYFTLEHPGGKPAPRFVIVANMETEDGGDAIVAGNERVLRARLSDARFFYEQDLKTPLRELRPKLDKIAFHAKLGSVLDRVIRLEKLVVEIAQSVPRGNPTQAIAAALLCKCDLVTGMVGEFPELQGVMGRYYALAQGEVGEVADAVRDHYKPLGPTDVCPTAPVSVVLALAEKIDTLVGFFAIGEVPTGSKDPYALRRAALGVIRLIVENGLRMPLRSVFQSAYEFYGTDGQHQGFTRSLEGAALLIDQLLSFFADRLKVVLRERGVRHDLIDAVFALGGEDDLVRLLDRVAALQEFLATEDGGNLLTAYKRAANILRIEEKRDGVSYEGRPDPALLTLPEESALAGALEAAGNEVAPLIAAENFRGAMAVYAKLRPIVDAFFDRVTVNADEPALRVNRLRLLSRIRSTLNKIAEFARIA